MKVAVKAQVQDHFIGYIHHIRRRVGDVFVIDDQPRRLPFPAEQKLIENNDEAKATYDVIKDKDGKIPKLFSFRWMEPVAANSAESYSTAQTSLDRRAEEINQEKAAQRANPGQPSTGSKDVL
jgi:hypothetical protein